MMLIKKENPNYNPDLQESEENARHIEITNRQGINDEFHKKIRQLFENNQEMIMKFKSFNSKLPYLYGTVKTHKDGNPLRPIISTVGTVSYELSKFLVNLLQPIVGTVSESHIKNSLHFVDIMNSRSSN